jgi:hypothetical protein
MTVQNIDNDCEFMKKMMADKENNNEEAEDNDEGKGNGDEKVMMMVMVMIAAKNMMTVIKKVRMKRLTIMMVEVMTIKKY